MSSDGTTSLIFTLQGDQQSLVANFGPFLPVQISGSLVALLEQITEAQVLVTEATLASNTAITSSGQAAGSASNAVLSVTQASAQAGIASTQAANAASSATASAYSATQAAASALAAAANALQAANSVSSLKVFDMIAFYPGLAPSRAIFINAITPQSVTYTAGLTTSYGIATYPATADAVFTINRVVGGAATAIGSAVFAAGSTTATFGLTTGVTTNPGDIIQIVGPATPDNTLANISFALVGTRI